MTHDGYDHLRESADTAERSEETRGEEQPEPPEPYVDTLPGYWCEYHGFRHENDAHAKMRRGEDWK